MCQSFDEQIAYVCMYIDTLLAFYFGITEPPGDESVHVYFDKFFPRVIFYAFALVYFIRFSCIFEVK